MRRLLAKPWELLKALFALAFPMFRPDATVATGALGAWLARGVLLAVVLTGLGLLNQWERLNLTRWIPVGQISKYWLPLFAFCSYAVIWLGWLLYRALNIDVGPVTTEFPEIDHAWDQAVRALEAAEIHLEETPLYLVLGSTASGEDSLFLSARFKGLVKEPKSAAEPIRVTANRDAVFVSCAGASVLGQQSYPLEGSGAADPTLETLSQESADLFRTAGAADGKTLRIEDFLAAQKHKVKPAREGFKHRDLIDRENQVARLRYLCRLIARDRQGFCPINGVLIVLPITSVNSQNSADELAAACSADLAGAFDVLPMRCPVLVLISDLEKLDGFSDLLERLSSEQVRQRMGQRFPLAPDLEAGLVPARIEDSVVWISNALFPSMVYSLFRVESPGGEDIAEVMRANSQLYYFLMKMRDRREWIGRVVKDSIPTLSGEPVLFGGCYFAGTGIDAVTGQAFASGVFNRLIQDQDHVAWTSNAVRQDRSLLRLARGFKIAFLGMIVLGALAILVVVARWWFFRSSDHDELDAARFRSQGFIRSRFCSTVLPDGTTTSLVSRRLVASFTAKT
jgi:hypothetical protein